MAICKGCDGFTSCRPDLPQWIAKKDAANNLHVSQSGLSQRAMRIGYVSAHRNGMPRSDQPKLCPLAHYCSLSAAHAERGKRGGRSPRRKGARA